MLSMHVPGPQLTYAPLLGELDVDWAPPHVLGRAGLINDTLILRRTPSLRTGATRQGASVSEVRPRLKAERGLDVLGRSGVTEDFLFLSKSRRDVRTT